MRRRQIIKGIPQRHPQIQKRPNKSKLRTATDGRSKNASEASKPAAAPLPSPEEDDEGSALQSVLFSRLISALSRDVFNFWYYTHGKVKRELSSDKKTNGRASTRKITLILRSQKMKWFWWWTWKILFGKGGKPQAGVSVGLSALFLSRPRYLSGEVGRR